MSGLLVVLFGRLFWLTRVLPPWMLEYKWGWSKIWGVYIAYGYEKVILPWVFPGFPPKLVSKFGTGRQSRTAIMGGDDGIDISLDISLENCMDSQGSCLLGCQSWNEADMKILGVYIALPRIISICFLMGLILASILAWKIVLTDRGLASLDARVEMSWCENF